MNKIIRFKTDFLFSTPTFLSGAATVINIAGNFYNFNKSESGFDADFLALENDFNIVGQDIYDAMEELASIDANFSVTE